MVVRTNACDVEVVVVECCGVNDCVMTGGSVEMTVVRLYIYIYISGVYFSEMRCNLDVCGVFPWDFFRATFLMYCVEFDVHS